MPIDYPEIVLPRLRYQFCPMCQHALQQYIDKEDGLARVHCPSCKWIHYPTQVQGVNLIIWKDGGIVALLPQGEPADSPAALPSGHIEYAEHPETAAIREAKEETGLEIEIIRHLGWYHATPIGYPGPLISFVYETRAIGGTLQESSEGLVKLFLVDQFPQISPNRKGSQRAMQIFKESLKSDADKPNHSYTKQGIENYRE